MPKGKNTRKKFYLLREEDVMLEKDLAEFYGVSLTAMKNALKKNKDRFPENFMFQVTLGEAEMIGLEFDAPKKTKAKSKTKAKNKNKAKSKAKSQAKTAKPKLPKAFTQGGVFMMASILDSEKAIEINKGMVQAFIKLTSKQAGP